MKVKAAVLYERNTAFEIEELGLQAPFFRLSRLYWGTKWLESCEKWAPALHR